MNKILLAFMSFFAIFNVYAGCSQVNNSVGGMLGLDQSNGTLYATLKSDKKECSCSHARFSPVNTDVNIALSILLSAKLSDRNVRVDFKESGDCNSAYRVYVY